MKKELRQKVHFKYCGKCAYCGKNIKYKEMQVDHIHPQHLSHLENLDNESLLNYCLTNKYASDLCKDDNFWEKRFKNIFGELGTTKPEKRSWKNHFLTVLYHLGKYEEEPWDFFGAISWLVNEPTEDIQYYIPPTPKLIKDQSEIVRNLYWFSQLGKEITIAYPIDKYQALTPIERIYKSNTKDFTPAMVLQLVYDFYKEHLTKE